MPRDDDSTVTWGDLKKIYKKLNDRITDAFQEIADKDENQTGFWNEHEDKIARHQRAIRRLNEEMTTHSHDSE